MALGLQLMRIESSRVTYEKKQLEGTRVRHFAVLLHFSATAEVPILHLQIFLYHNGCQQSRHIQDIFVAAIVMSLGCVWCSAEDRTMHCLRNSGL